MRNGIPTGDFLTYSAQLDSVATRMKLSVPFLAGKKIQLIQR
jgi:hypothetical protein